MFHPVDIFVLDEMDTKVLEAAFYRAFNAGVSTKLKGIVSCQTGFDDLRKQWRADVLCAGCFDHSRLTAHMAVIITNRDLYIPMLSFVFGLARRDVNVAIVSLFRLEDEHHQVVADRLAKEIFHETGHLSGLNHCINSSCVMRYSKTISDVDLKGIDYCYSCGDRMRSSL